MNKKRIVITGIGVVSSIGIGKESYWEALKKGQSGIRPITIFNTDSYTVKSAGEITEFDPKEYFTKRELINSDRATALLLLSSKMALEDSKVTITADNTNGIGVSVGTTFGSLQSLSEFDKESVTKGPQLVNPSRFPNTVANLPASQVSIYFKIKGFNTTVSTGMCAGLDAIDCSIKAITNHNRKIILTAGLEEMCEQIFLGFYKLKYLSGANSNGEIFSRPFDRRRNGIVFGEGCGVVVLEDLESAQKRRAHIYAEIGGFASSFDPFRMNRYNPKGIGMMQAMKLALEKAKLQPKDIDYICANANSTVDGDLAEARAIKKVFGAEAKKIPTSSIKSMIGETYSAGGMLSTIAAIGAICNNFIPPTINTQNIDPAIDFNLVVNKAREADIKTVMINAFGQNGACSSLIIKRYKN
jgi:3-oxoacyl-[acyl-carrier-protein] synthase II